MNKPLGNFGHWVKYYRHHDGKGQNPCPRGGYSVWLFFSPWLVRETLQVAWVDLPSIRQWKETANTLLSWRGPGIQQLQPHQLQGLLSGLTFENIASIIKGQYLLVLAQKVPRRWWNTAKSLHGGLRPLPFSSDPRQADTFVTWWLSSLGRQGVCWKISTYILI